MGRILPSQRFNTSDPTNQPKSALSAKMHISGLLPEAKALAAAEEPLESMMRRIISEYRAKPTETTRAHPSQPNNLRRQIPQAERDAYNKGLQDARMARPPYKDRPNAQAMTQSRNQGRYNKPPQVTASTTRQVQGQGKFQPHGRNQTGHNLKNGDPPDTRRRTQERRAFSAAKQRDEDEEDPSHDPRDHYAFSASRLDNEDQEEEEDGDDRYAMKGKRDYSFNGPYDSDEGDT